MSRQDRRRAQGAPRRTRRRKSKRRSYLVPALIGVGVCLVLGAFLGIAGWLAARPDVIGRVTDTIEGATQSLGESVDSTSDETTEPAVIESWPPPPGMPRADIFADQGGESVVPVTDDNQFDPLRRRFVDPWIVISNPRIEDGPRDLKTLVVDYEFIELPMNTEGRFIEVYFVLRRTGPSDASNPRSIMRPLLSQGGNSAQFMFREEFERFDHVEIYVTALDSDYQLSLSDGSRQSDEPPAFKVSNSLFLGAPFPQTHAREWSESEFALLTSEPAPQELATTGEVSPASDEQPSIPLGFPGLPEISPK